MIQPDHWIRDQAGMITPFIGTKIRRFGGRTVVSYGLSSFGYDIRLAADDLRCYRTDRVVDPKRTTRDDTVLVPVRDNPQTGERYIEVAPGQMILGYSVERFAIPSDVIGVVCGKSTVARTGISLLVTPLEAGWSGHITLEFANVSDCWVRVYVNEGIGQVLFFRGERPETTYGDGLYQDQPARVVLPMRGGE